MKQTSSKRRRIMYIDDDPNLVDIIENVMRILNYDVTTSMNSIMAFEAIKENPSGFDLVITDMNMPEITGIQLSKEILKIRPDLPVILCTGSDKISDEDEIKQNGIKKVLYKPYPINELATAVNEVLK